jgi:hypothetical protein
VTLWPVALTDTRGTVALVTSVNNAGDTRAVAGSTTATAVAPCATLDELIPEAVVDMIKMDIQGSELSCVRGMLGLINRSPHIRIITEIWPAEILRGGLRPGVALDFYRSLGFRYVLIGNGSLSDASNDEILAFCRSCGPEGQANLMLTRA